MKYNVEIIETRIIKIVVEAKDEQKAFECAEDLYETDSSIVEKLNNPLTATDAEYEVSAFNLLGDETLEEGEKVYIAK